MNARETLGLILIVIGLILTPVAWMFSRSLCAITLMVLFFGAYLFYSERMIKKQEKLNKKHGEIMRDSSGPTDVNNNPGWGSSGNSETIDFGDDDY